LPAGLRIALSFLIAGCSHVALGHNLGRWGGTAILLPPNLRLSNQNSGLLVSNVKSSPNYFHLLFKTEISDSKRVTHALLPGCKALLFQFSRHDGGRFSRDLRWQFIWRCDQLRNPCIIGKSSGDAGVAKLADAQDLGSCGLKTVEVQLLSPAPDSLNHLCANCEVARCENWRAEGKKDSSTAQISACLAWNFRLRRRRKKKQIPT